MLRERIWCVERLNALVDGSPEASVVVIDFVDGQECCYAEGADWFRLTKETAIDLEIYVERAPSFYMVVGDEDV